jgi:hypothetical protein
MKFFTILTLSLLFRLETSSAAEQTLFAGEVEHGGYGAPVIKFTQIHKEFGVLVGGQGGWIINHGFGIGGGGWGLVTEHEPPAYPKGDDEGPLDLAMGYGGVILSYYARPDRLAHLTFDLLIGGGALSLYREQHDWDEDRWGRDGFFIVEPSIGAELNITTFMRWNAGVSYRAVSGVEYYGYKDSDIGGFAGWLLIKFGRF